jgi:FG-GAP repeat/FG-GAP-like repeat
MATLKITILLLSLLAVLPSCILVERVEYTPFMEEEPPPPPPTPSIPKLRFPMNNSYQGSVFSGTLRPAFQWEPASWDGPETIRYEFQLSTDSYFSTGVTEVQTTAVSHQPVEELAVSRNERPVGARYFWRVRACVADSCSAFSKPWWLNLGRAQRDLNGDGFADMVVATHGGNQRPVGNLYIYAGKQSTGFNGPHSRALIGNDEVWFKTLAAAGDFNGDGYSDIAARVTKRDRSDPRIHLYLGNKDSYISLTPEHILAASDCTFAGDLNGDGFDDLVVPTGLVYGTKGTPQIIPIELPEAPNPIGDVNGDGFSDLLFQVTGGASIYFGGSVAPLDLTADAFLRGTGQFAHAASAAGDMNGDGFGDILVANWGDEAVPMNGGRAYVYFGNAGNSLDEEVDGVIAGNPNELLGVGVHALGDINNDGFDDIGIRLVSPSAQEVLKGGIRIYFGKAGKAVSTTYDTQLLGVTNGSYFGRGLAFGDMNGDGFDDLMVGAPGYFADGGPPAIGQAYVFLGNAGRTLEPYPDGTITGPVAESLFGEMAMDNTRDKLL